MFVNWLFHGLLYMDRTERAFYVLLEGLLFLPIFFAFSAIANLSWRLLSALIVGHTLHWLFNGHLYVVLREFGLSRVEKGHFARYAWGLRGRIAREKSMLAGAIFGSLSRGELESSSDLDVRFIRRLGFSNGLRACAFTFLERSRALLDRFPLDVYVLDTLGPVLRMRVDESPIILYDPENVLARTFDQSSHLEEIRDMMVDKPGERCLTPGLKQVHLSSSSSSHKT